MYMIFFIQAFPDNFLFINLTYNVPVLSLLRMAANNDSHNFKIQDKKPDNLPGEKLTLEPCSSGWNRWISLILIPFY